MTVFDYGNRSNQANQTHFMVRPLKANGPEWIFPDEMSARNQFEATRRTKPSVGYEVISCSRHPRTGPFWTKKLDQHNG
jgi:hypothetical protein